MMAESQAIGNLQASKKHSTSKSVGYIKMIVIPDLKAGTEINAVKGNIDKDCEFVTDASTFFGKLKIIVAKHSPPSDIF